MHNTKRQGRDAEEQPAGGDCPWEAAVRARVETALGHGSFRALGVGLHLNAETLRRQIRGEAHLSLRVLAAVCERTGVSADWLLFGVGPRLHADRTDERLLAIPTQRLIAALAERIGDEERSRRTADAPPSDPGAANPPPRAPIAGSNGAAPPIEVTQFARGSPNGRP